jgi:copper transport protein
VGLREWPRGTDRREPEVSIRRACKILLLTGVVLLLWVLPAGAHALVRSSNPPANALLASAPSQVLITFTEPPDPSLSVVHVLDSTGTPVESGKAQAVPGEPLELRVPLGALPDGVYTVTWRTVSRTDGHVTGGSFAFGVNVSPVGVLLPSGSTEARTPSPSALAVAGRWALYWGLAVLLGAAVFVTFVSRDIPPRGRTILVLAWVGAAVGLVMMTLAERSAVGVSLGTLLGSHSGRELIAQGLALVIVGAGVAVVVAEPRWTSFPPLGLAVTGALLVHAYSGHASGQSSWRWFNLGAQWVHLLAVGVWVGGLVWLLAWIRGRDSGDRAGVVRRFSNLALFAVGAVAFTGLLRALDEVGGPGAWRRLFHTSFGVTLLIKVLLFGALLVLGTRNRYVNVPGLSSGARPIRSLRRTVVAELLLVAGVLGLTGILSELPPSALLAASQASQRGPDQIVVNGSDFATTIKIRLTVTPGTVGPNVFVVDLADYDTGAPVVASGVSLRFTFPGRPDIRASTMDLSKSADGTWAGTGAALSIEGTWTVTVVVQEPANAVEVPLSLQTRSPPEDITVLKEAGQPTLYTITLSTGDTVQTYVDPGAPGTNQVHFTFFKPSGDELPIASATATGTPPSGTAMPLDLTRFDPGHFVANVDLLAGKWRFQVQATADDGQTISVYFDQDIGT